MHFTLFYSLDWICIHFIYLLWLIRLGFFLSSALQFCVSWRLRSPLINRAAFLICKPTSSNYAKLWSLSIKSKTTTIATTTVASAAAALVTCLFSSWRRVKVFAFLIKRNSRAASEIALLVSSFLWRWKCCWCCCCCCWHVGKCHSFPRSCRVPGMAGRQTGRQFARYGAGGFCYHSPHRNYCSATNLFN